MKMLRDINEVKTISQELTQEIIRSLVTRFEDVVEVRTPQDLIDLSYSFFVVSVKKAAIKSESSIFLSGKTFYLNANFNVTNGDSCGTYVTSGDFTTTSILKTKLFASFEEAEKVLYLISSGGGGLFYGYEVRIHECSAVNDLTSDNDCEVVKSMFLEEGDDGEEIILKNICYKKKHKFQYTV